MTNNTPMVSVIVPVYNVEKYLRRCLDSILCQTYTDWECLLVDDGSTDRSGEILDEYARKDSRFIVFHKPNGGVSSARNVGLDNAKGEWITFVDADDWIMPLCLSSYALYFDEEYDCIVQGFESDKALYVSLNEGFMARRRHGICFKGLFKEGLILLYENSIVGYLWCKAFKAEIIKTNKINFNPLFNYQEDEEFFLRYGVHCDKIVCDNVTVIHYKVPNCEKKYSRPGNMFTLHLSCIKSLKQIYHDDFKSLPDNKVAGLTMNLQRIYEQGLPSRKEKLRIYRQTVGKSILTTNLFWLTKYFIYLDYTEFFSDLVLRLHSVIKKRYHHNNVLTTHK